MIEVLEYVDLSGRNTFAFWSRRLDRTTRSRVFAVIQRVRDGNLAAAKSVGAGVQELRLDFGPSYRIYFGRSGDTLVILLGGGTKNRQESDIASAQALWQEYKNSKQE